MTRLIAEAGELRRATSWAARAIAIRPADPVMAAMMLHVVDSRLTVSGFDYEVSTEADVELDIASSTGTMDQPAADGRVLVPGHLFAQIAAKLEGPVAIDLEPGCVLVCAGRDSYRLPRMRETGYPALPVLPPTVGRVDGESFARAVAQVAPAARTDDAVPQLASIRVHTPTRAVGDQHPEQPSRPSDQLWLWATDRYRIAHARLPWQPTGEQAVDVLVDPAALAALTRPLTGQVELFADETSFGFSGNGLRAVVRQIGQDHLDLERHLRFMHQATLHAPRTELLAALDRVSLISDRYQHVELHLSPAGPLRIASCPNADTRQAETTVDATYTGPGHVLRINSRYLQTALAGVDTEHVQLGFDDHAVRPIAPVMVQPVADPGGLPDVIQAHAIVPVRRIPT